MADLTDPAGYTFWTREILRFNDLDTVGHVNNNAYGVFFENGRVIAFRRALAMVEAAGGTVPYDWAVRRTETDFLKEMHVPGEITVGTRFARFGNTSVTVEQAVFKDGACCATAMNVVVCFDPVARKSTPIPPEMREALTTLSAQGQEDG